MIGKREEIELRRIVESFLRHASCRFNCDLTDLRAGPGSGRAREVDPQFAESAEIERGADLGQLTALNRRFNLKTVKSVISLG